MIIKTKSGRQIECEEVSAAGDEVLYIIVNMSITDAAQIFDNPAETATIAAGENIYEGYSKIENMVRMGDFTRVSLRRP